MAEGRQITFISLKSFDKRFSRLVDDDDRAALEEVLAQRPTAGDLIPGSGGARKLRWARPGQGKRGGVRVIYYFHDGKGSIWFIDVYAKSEKDDLTAGELKSLAMIVRELKE